MDSYVYTDMAEKVHSLEVKIQQLEKIYKNTAKFEVKKSQYHFGTTHYLIDLTRELKNYLLYKPLGNYYDSKVLGQMYDRICTLESELNNLLLPKRQEQNRERDVRDQIPPLVCNVERFPFHIYNNCDKQCASPFKRYKVKYNPNKCIPPETFFEQLSMYTNITGNQTSTDSLEEIKYYDNLSSYSSSSLTTIIDYYGPSQPKKTVYSRYLKNVPINIRKSKPKFKNKNVENRLIKQKKVKHSRKSVPIRIKKSKSKDTFKHKKQRVVSGNKNRKARASNISIKKQQNPKEQPRKNVKKQHKSKRKRPLTKLRLSKSESPKIKVYSSNFPKRQQESEIYFIRKRKRYPQDNDNYSNKEKHFISRLKRMNTPSVRKGGRKVTSLKKNRSSPIIIRKTNYTDAKPPRNNSLKFEKLKNKNGKNKSETSLESLYVKSKRKRSKRSKFQTNTGYGNHSLVVASGSVVLNTPFLESRPNSYSYFLGFNNSGISSSSETFSSSSSESKRGLRRLTSGEISFINKNYEIIESYYDVDTKSDEEEMQFSPVTKEPKERLCSFPKPELPTTVYTVINKIPEVSSRAPTLNNDIVYINSNVSPLHSTNFLDGSKKQLNFENLDYKKNKFKKEFSRSSRNDDIVNLLYNQPQKGEVIPSNTNKYAPIYKYKEDSKTKLKKPFGEGSIANSVYLSTIPVNQFNLPNVTDNNITRQQNNHSLQINTNVPENKYEQNETVYYNQTNLLVEKHSPVLTQVLSTNMKPNSELQSNIMIVSSRNVTKENNLNIYQVHTEDTKNPSDSKRRLKKSLSRIFQSTNQRSKGDPTDNLTSNQPLKGKRDSKKLQIGSNSSTTPKTIEKPLNSQQFTSDNSRRKLNKNLSKDIKSENLSDKQLKSRKPQNKKLSMSGKPIKSSLSFKNIFRRTGKTKKKGLSTERSENSTNDEQSSVTQKLPPGVSRRLAQNISDKTSDEIENIYGPRSISKLLEHFDTMDSSTMIQKDVQNDTSKKRFTRKNSIRRAVMNHKQDPTTNQKDCNKLNYSLHYAKTKRRNVEMCSIPSSLSLADIVPSKCKTILSMEEIFLSEHKFNGMELHGKVHEIFVRPNDAIDKVKSKYFNVPRSNSVKIKHNKNSQDNCGCVSTTRTNNLNLNKSIPIFKSGQVSDSSYFVDWKKIAHEVKEYY